MKIILASLLHPLLPGGLAYRLVFHPRTPHDWVYTHLRGGVYKGDGITIEVMGRRFHACSLCGVTSAIVWPFVVTFAPRNRNPPIVIDRREFNWSQP